MTDSRHLPMDGITGAMPAPRHVDVLQTWPHQPVEYVIPKGAARIIATSPHFFQARPDAAPVLTAKDDNEAHLAHELNGRGGVVAEKIDWLADGIKSIAFVSLGPAIYQAPISIQVFFEG